MSPSNSRPSLPENLEDGGRWYFSRKELEENSPSRIDGIDLEKETYLRKAYCTFLQDLGMKLKLPQVTIATAIIFCHRFYLRQSHAKNDSTTIATACMFLAGKGEDTLRFLKDVILVSFEIINKKDPAAAQKIKQKELYQQQKERILLAVAVVLTNLGFDMNVQNPYKQLVEAIKKFKIADGKLAQAAWNFVNDGLWTTLCLQFEPHHIAAGALFLAANLSGVKLPSDGDKVWWQEFDVTPHQLKEVCSQMYDLYEPNRLPALQTIEADGSSAVVEKGTSKGLIEEHANTLVASRSGGTSNPASEPVNNGCSSDYRMETPSNNEREERKGEDGEDEHHMSLSHNRLEHAVTVGKESVTTGEVIKRFDEDMLKQLREKRKKYRADGARRSEVTLDDYDLIVEELEEGVELAAAAASSAAASSAAAAAASAAAAAAATAAADLKRKAGSQFT